MNRLFPRSLITLLLVLGIVGCEKREVTPPLPKVDAGAVKQKAEAAVDAGRAAAVKEKDQFVAAVSADVEKVKAEIGQLKDKLAKASGKAKTTMEQQMAALEGELKGAEQKLTDLKSATAEKWQELQNSMNAAMDQLRQSVGKAQKDFT